MAARKHEFYFRVAKQNFTNAHTEWIKYCFWVEKIEFKCSSRRGMSLLVYRHECCTRNKQKLRHEKHSPDNYH